jgi:hypothetical protein
MSTDPRDQAGGESAAPVAGHASTGDDEHPRYAGSATGYRDEPMERHETMRYGDVGNRDNRPIGDIRTRKVRETKPAFLTTEFWFTVGGIAALIIVYLVADDASLDLFRTALLATLIGISYVLSRGLAKAGSRTTRQAEDPRLTPGYSPR